MVHTNTDNVDSKFTHTSLYILRKKAAFSSYMKGYTSTSYLCNNKSEKYNKNIMQMKANMNSHSDNNNQDHNRDPNELGSTSYEQTLINWYPGHIAKAERELEDYLKLVDVVIEARDARIPESTTHPMVSEWVGNRPLIVVHTRNDMVSPHAKNSWTEFYNLEQKKMSQSHEGGRRQRKIPKLFINSQKGEDIHKLKMICLKAGQAVNLKRQRKGLLPRSVRVAVIGYPNVGKSAIINRLIGRKIAKSRNLPGVTKKIQWIRINDGSTRKDQQLELLDSPGIIPAKQVNQETALKLAICNDIGHASYDVQVVAAKLLDYLKTLFEENHKYVDLTKISKRYNLPLSDFTGEAYLYEIAQVIYRGNMYSAADRVIADFRKGYFGNIALEYPPKASKVDKEDINKIDQYQTIKVDLLNIQKRKDTLSSFKDQDLNLDTNGGSYKEVTSQHEKDILLEQNTKNKIDDVMKDSDDDDDNEGKEGNEDDDDDDEEEEEEEETKGIVIGKGAFDGW